MSPLTKMGLHGSWTAELVLRACASRSPTGSATRASGSRLRCPRSTAAASVSPHRLSASLRERWMRRWPRRGAAATRGVDFDAPTLADMEVRTAASRQLTRHAAALVDAGERVTLDAAIAKLYSTDTCVAVAQAAVDLCAPESGADDHPAAVRFRDAKACQIYEGTNQIQRMVIARHVFNALTRAQRAMVASKAWTSASTKSRPRSATRFATSLASGSRLARRRSIGPASSHGTSSTSIASTTCSRCRFRPSTAGFLAARSRSTSRSRRSPRSARRAR